MTKLFLIKINRLKLYSFTLLLLAALVVIIGSLEYYSYIDREWSYADKQPLTPPSGRVSIVIKQSGRALELYNDGKLYKRYPVAVGKDSSPTPIGEWNIVHKERSWRDVFGTRWLGLDVPWGSYGLHGTNMPWSIGHFASHGCIRMRNKDVEELYEWVPVGTHVRITGTPDKINRVLRPAMIGQDVVFLQLKLKELGYLDIRATGIFAQDTEEAVRRYQHDKGLKITGIVDFQMLKLLGL